MTIPNKCKRLKDEEPRRHHFSGFGVLLAKICKMFNPSTVVSRCCSARHSTIATASSWTLLSPPSSHFTNPNLVHSKDQPHTIVLTAVRNLRKHEAPRRSGRMCHLFGDDGVRIFFHRRSAPRGSSSLDTNHHRRQRSNEHSSIRPQKPSPETAQRGYGWKWQPIRRRRPG